MSRPTCAYIGLGSNLGDRSRYLREAVAALAGTPGVALRRASPVYESRAHTLQPDLSDPPYLNAVVEVETTLGPEALLAACHAIERAAGRDRATAPKWAPRTLDLDILLFGSLSFETPHLTLPHPRLPERRFVLQPLADLAPGLCVPPFGSTVAALLEACPDRGPLVKTTHILR